MPGIVPIALQITEEQQQVINKIAASVAPLLGSCDCILLTLILRKHDVEKTGDQTTEQRPTVPETLIPPKQETFTVAGAAQFLNVNPATVYRLIYLGHLKVLRSFGRLRISRQQLERLLSQTEIYTPRRRRRK
jgi:excisionase family DNA binding protein